MLALVIHYDTGKVLRKRVGEGVDWFFLGGNRILTFVLLPLFFSSFPPSLGCTNSFPCFFLMGLGLVLILIGSFVLFFYIVHMMTLFYFI